MMSVEDWEAKMVDSCNRSLRTALHKNVVEQSNCDSTTRTLDAQKRWVHSRLTKEEREVRQQLQHLQLEQKHLSEHPASSASGMHPGTCIGICVGPIIFFIVIAIEHLYSATQRFSGAPYPSQC